MKLASAGLALLFSATASGCSSSAGSAPASSGSVAESAPAAAACGMHELYAELGMIGAEGVVADRPACDACFASKCGADFEAAFGEAWRTDLGGGGACRDYLHRCRCVEPLPANCAPDDACAAYLRIRSPGSPPGSVVKCLLEACASACH